MYTLEQSFVIFGSHYLKDQGGKCRNLHGHEYKIILTLVSSTLEKPKNMIIDTYDLEKLFWEAIGTDHVNLNDLMETENPTMEFMSRWFFEKLEPIVPLLKRVTVFETKEACVTYESQ